MRHTKSLRFGLTGLVIAAGAIGMLPGVGQAGEFPDAWFFYPENHETRKKHAELVGKPAPELSNLTGWVNGKPQSLKGSIVVLDFWATWCGPCIAAIPHTNEVAARYADKGVTVVGVCTSGGQENMAEVAREHGMKYPTARDPGNESAKRWRIMFYPTYAVVDREGKVRAIGLRPDAVEKVIERLLAEDEKAAEGEPADDSRASADPGR